MMMIEALRHWIEIHPIVSALAALTFYTCVQIAYWTRRERKKLADAHEAWDISRHVCL